MGNMDAEEKFFEAVNTFKEVDEKARSGNLENIDTNAFKMVIINLDAAIPGLNGLMLGRALLLKAMSLNWLFLAKPKPRLFDVEAPPDPLLEKGLSCALEGRKILEEFGAEDLPWANDIVIGLGGR